MVDPVARSWGASVRARLALVLPLSFVLHGVLLLLSDDPTDPETEQIQTLSCPDLCHHRLHDNYVWFDFATPELAEAPPEPPEAPAEEEPAPPEPAELEPLPENYYMVHLPNPEEVEPPEDTPYLAEDNNRTDEEVVAEVTTLREAAAGEEREGPTPEDSEQAAATAEDERSADGPDGRLALAEGADGEPGGEVVDMAALARASTAAPLLGSNPNSPSVPDSGRPNDISRFQPRLESYQVSQLAAEDLGERQRIAREVRHDGFLGDDEEEWARTRASLENMVPEVRAGTETRLNTRRHAYAEYLSYVHRRIHEIWAEEYLMRLDLEMDPFDPLSNPDLEAVLELVIGANGEVARVNIVQTSGITEFDGEAIGVAYGIGPLQAPPDAIVSDNGNAYIHWTFWRDQRQCGTFGASVHRVQ